MVQAGDDMQAAFLERLFKQRGGVQLDGAQHSLGDFRISLARAVQVGYLTPFRLGERWCVVGYSVTPCS